MRRSGSSFIILLLLSCLLASCASVAPSRLKQRHLVPLVPVTNPFALPELQSESVAQVGDTMIAGGRLYQRPAIRLPETVTHHGISKGKYTLTIPATVLIASGTFRQGALTGTFYEAPQPLRFVAAAGSGTVRGGVAVFDQENLPPEIYWHATDTGVPLVDPHPGIQFEETTHEEWKGDSFRRELVYNGRSGGTIKLLYREFIDERIRPAFTQEVTYDLEQGQTIGFKGARFQVLDADNIQIRFIVLRHFD